MHKTDCRQTTPHDDTMAVMLYKKSVEHGSERGMNNLGWMYEHGFGIEKNCPEAMLLYQKATALEDTLAAKNLKRLTEQSGCTTQARAMELPVASMVIFPNPCRDRVVLQLPGKLEHKTRIDIYDMQGSIRQTIFANGASPEVSIDLPDGLYVITAINGEKKWTERISVIK